MRGQSRDGCNKDEKYPCNRSRVKTAIAKKEETIQELRLNYQEASEQIEHLEAMLNRQAKEKLLGKA